MTLLTPKIRKYFIEEICNRFHEEGISRLKIVGHFEKYTPLFHFRIDEPNKEDFIYITELFGDPKTESDLFNGGIRKQYHGNYKGLSRIILQGVNPYLNNPSFNLYKKNEELQIQDILKFDNSLKYIKDILETMTPITKNFEIGHDFFSETYNV